MKSPDNSETSRWSIRVRHASASLDGHGREVLSDVRQAGLDHIEGVVSSRIYMLQGRLDRSSVELIADELLTDPVAERAEVSPGLGMRTDNHPAVEVHTLPGVMSSVAITALDAARRLLAARCQGGETVEAVRTARCYEFVGARSADDLDRAARRVLANDCIERWFVRGFGRTDKIPEQMPESPQSVFEISTVTLRGRTDEDLARLSREGHLFLSLEEMHTIGDHFQRLDRDPTDLELETLAQTWSEHCVHKTLKSAIHYRGAGFGSEGLIDIQFDNLLKETIVAATKTLDRDWCLSVFVDNAGIMVFDEEWGVAIKVETHNHPSAIEPYGGAATGIGGCIRDVMGCGLGAKPIASTDVFCLAPPDFDASRLPAEVLHPRRVLKGVVGGVRDYGNRMGIPTVNGAICFDDRYLANPLVFCGCVGMIPRNRITKEPRPGDHIVVAGGRTGRDGIHGATFSSAELTDTHADEFSHAVQIGNALEEKKVLDAELIARDHPSGCLYSSVTDCGAGGLSSAVGEMGAELGVEVNLEKVPLKYAGLRYDEIWISEAQERMVYSVPPHNLDEFLRVFAKEEVEATVIGTFTDDNMLRVKYEGALVGELGMPFLHNGLPKTRRTASWKHPGGAPVAMPWASSDRKITNDRLLAELALPNVASKEWVIRQYDHEVQGHTAVKPLVGPGDGPSDAAVLLPRHDSDRGIAIGCGLCPELAEIDPYMMAQVAVDEALRNIVCVGADPAQTAILDNFCWPKVDTEESLGSLVRTCQGAHDAAVAFGLPFVSGKDSLNNQFSMSEEEAKRVGLPSSIAIPATLLVTSLGIVPDVKRCVTSDLKQPGNRLVLASRPLDAHGLEAACELHQQVAALIASGAVRSAHDVSEGGLAVALAEMCIASNLGADVSLDADEFDVSIFASVPTTYVLEMSESAAATSGFADIGQVMEAPQLMIRHKEHGTIDLAVATLAATWKAPLQDGGGR